MPTYLFSVADRFLLEQGVTLVPGIPPGVIVQIGDEVELRPPLAAPRVVRIGSLNLVCRRNPDGHLPLTLPKELGVHDVPIGTEVWLMDRG